MESKTYNLRRREPESPGDERSNRKVRYEGIKALSEAARLIKKEEDTVKESPSFTSPRQANAIAKPRDKTDVAITETKATAKSNGKRDSTIKESSTPKRKRTDAETSVNPRHVVSSQEPAPSESARTPRSKKEPTWREIVWKDLGVNVNFNQDMDWKALLKKHGVPIEELDALL